MKRNAGILHTSFVILGIAVLLLLTHWFDPFLFFIVSRLAGKRPQPTWSGYLNTGLVLALFAGFFAWLKIAWNIPSRAWFRQIRQEPARLPQDATTRYRFSWIDSVIVLLFILCSIIFFLDKIQGPFPYVNYNSDAGNIISFAAAQKYPALFAGDELLSNPENLRSYSTVNVLLVNFLEKWAGNFTLAFAWLGIPQLIINLLGFYFLGMVLFDEIAVRQRRFWAFLLTVVLAIPYSINVSETWGAAHDAITRYNFQALLPFLLILAILWQKKPRWWPVLMILVGLMSFVHPVSTPSWTLAFWLGIAVLLPPTWSRGKKVLVMAGLAALVIFSLLPYTRNFLGNYSIQRQALSYAFATFIIQQYFPLNILDVPRSLFGFLKLTWSSGLLPMSVISFCVLLALQWRDPRKIKMAVAWMAGILIASLLVPWVEHLAEGYFNIAPIETELVRGLRYAVFLMLVFCVWALAEIYRRSASRAERYIVAGLSVALAVGWIFAANIDLILPFHLADCVKTGNIVCVQYSDDDLIVQAVREHTPTGAALFSTFANQGTLAYSLAFRYQSLRPVVYSYKDRGQLVTARSPEVKTWYYRLLAMNAIDDSMPSSEKMALYIPLARQWGANYIVADFKTPAEFLRTQNARLIYENDSYQLIQLGN